MLIRNLLGHLNGICHIGNALSPDAELTGAHSDSRRIHPGDLFIALPGYRSDGIHYLRAAFSAGARAALVPADTIGHLPTNLISHCLGVDTIRTNAAVAACWIYNHPTASMLCFGVTGTNGKTSTCYILKHLLQAAGHRVVILTTVAHEYADWHEETPNTTPDAPLLQAVLHRARQAGASAAVVEVSAHGVLLERIGGCVFDSLVFTNLALDHQDFFDGIQPYFAQKRRLFTDRRYHKPRCHAAIGCSDDYGRQLYADCRLPAMRFGDAQSTPVDVDINSLHCDPRGLRGTLSLGGQRFAVQTSLNSSYNRLNLAGATAAALQAGIPPSAIAQALQQSIQVPGRLMNVPSGAPFRVVVDFAHTEAAMDNLLRGLRDECENRLLVVFGAGGDKDPARRRTLPAVVLDLADVGIITLDNPRSESPQHIIDTMVNYWRQLARHHRSPARLQVEPDRPRAIAHALASAGPGDIVVLAGKGHETTQIFADRIDYHDDYGCAAAWLARNYPSATQPAATARTDTAEMNQFATAGQSSAKEQ